jgi:hypothetical protein
LTTTLPDMHSDTTGYIRLQNAYKSHASAEKAEFKSYVVGEVDDELVNAFVKNAHALRVLEGRRWGALDADQERIATVLSEHKAEQELAAMMAGLASEDGEESGAGVPKTTPKLPMTHFVVSAFFDARAVHGTLRPTKEQVIEQYTKITGESGQALEDKAVVGAVGEM